MAETKFIFTADDSQLQGAIARVKKSLGDIGVVSQEVGKDTNGSLKEFGDDLVAASEKANKAGQSIVDYGAKMQALKLEIRSLKTDLDNMPVGTDDKIIKSKQEQIKALQEQLKEYQRLDNEVFAKSGVKFYISAPPQMEKGGGVNFDATNNFSKDMNAITELRNAISDTRAEYEKLSKGANTGDNSVQQLERTKNALVGMEEHYKKIIAAYTLAKNTLAQLNAELAKAKSDNNSAMVTQIQEQIAEIEPVFKELTDDYTKVNERYAELKEQRKALTEEIKQNNTSTPVDESITNAKKIEEAELAWKKLVEDFKVLNEELTKAKENGDKALADTLSKQIEDTEKKAAKLNKELEKLQKEEKELSKARGKLASSSESLKGADGDSAASSTIGVFSMLKDAIEDAKRSMQGFKGGMSQLSKGFSGIAKGGTSAAEGVEAVASGASKAGGALASLCSNPYVLLAAVILGLISSAFVALAVSTKKFLTETQEGVEKLSPFKGAFNGLREVVRQLSTEIGRLVYDLTIMMSLLVGSLIEVRSLALLPFTNAVHNAANALKALVTATDFEDFKKKFKDGLESPKETVTGIFDRLKTSFGILKKEMQDFDPYLGITDPKKTIMTYMQAEIDEQQLIKEEREWKKRKAELQAEKAEFQQIMYSGGRIEQMDAMDAIRENIINTYETEIRLAERARDIQKAKVDNAGKSVTIEEQDKLAQLEVNLLNLERGRDNELKSIARRYKSVTSALGEQRKAFERELLSIRREEEKLGQKNEHEQEMYVLKYKLKFEDDINKKLSIQGEIRKKNLEYTKQELLAQKELALEQLRIEKESRIKETYGEDALKEYLSSGTLSNDSQGLLSFYKSKENGIIQKYNLDVENATNAATRDALDEDLSNYETYLQGMLNAEEQYQEELKRIREKYSLEADADVENINNKQIRAEVKTAQTERSRTQAIVKRETGLQDENMITQLAELGGKVAGKAKDEIRKAYDEFIKEVNTQIAETKGQMAAVEKVSNGGNASELKSAAEMELQTTQAQLATDNISPSERNILLEQEAVLKAEIAYYDTIIEGTASSYNDLLYKQNQLVLARNQAENASFKEVSSASTTQEKAADKITKKWETSVKSMEVARDAARSIADVFGGALSDESKKALDVVIGVADAGISAVTGIGDLVSTVTNGFTITTAAAVEGMKGLERASFILTIISIAIQFITAIAKLLSQFTTGAQIQKAIDDHLAKVDELKKQQQLIEAQYATSQGSEYYKGLVKSGKEYKKIIEETNKALADAEALYQHNLSKYGADSDKTKEAKEQRDDIAADNQENINNEIELWRGLMEELSGTSLDSFAENLADALIEGFAMGKEGIGDVWEDTMDDLLRVMLRNQLAIALKDQFKEAFESLTNATKQDGVLSRDEMDAFLANLEAGKEKAEQIAGAYYDAMSEAGLLDDADAEGSEGFGQMTQDQADALTARFTAVQIEMSNVAAATQAMASITTTIGEDTKLGVASLQSLLYNSNIALQLGFDQLDQLQAIADNTAILNETNSRLKAIEQNTGRL